MAYGGLHICSLACAFLCAHLTLTAAKGILTVSSKSANSITLTCSPGRQMELSSIEWSGFSFTNISADFQHECRKRIEQLFFELCKGKEQCNLPINSECLDRDRLFVNYMCRTQSPQRSYRKADCPPCPTRLPNIVKIDITLSVIVAILVVTNLIQISCFLYIAKKKEQPVPELEQQADGLRLSRATTARRLPPDYAGRLATVPERDFTSGVIAKKDEGAKKRTKVMGAKLHPAQHHFSVIEPTSAPPPAAATDVTAAEPPVSPSPVIEDKVV